MARAVRGGKYRRRAPIYTIEQFSGRAVRFSAMPDIVGKPYRKRGGPSRGCVQHPRAAEVTNGGSICTIVQFGIKRVSVGRVGGATKSLKLYMPKSDLYTVGIAAIAAGKLPDSCRTRQISPPAFRTVLSCASTWELRIAAMSISSHLISSHLYLLRESGGGNARENSVRHSQTRK